MPRITGLLLTSLFCGAIALSPIVDFQEQFSDLSHGIEFELQQYRAKNNHIRSEVIQRRLLQSLGNLTVEIRGITADYWAQIEAHERATPECLELLRPKFDYYAGYASLDIQGMASNVSVLMQDDAKNRFKPVMLYALRENSRATYQTVQTLGRNRFLDNMVDTVAELQEELEYYQKVWEGFREWLDEELDEIELLEYRLEKDIEWWHDYTVKWHRVFMEYQLERPDYECDPIEGEEKSVRSDIVESMSGKLKEMGDRKSLKGR